MKLKISKEFKIGFFGILMIAALYWGVNFLKGTDVFTSKVHYYAVYDQVNGLQPSAPVLIKGFKVGTVSGLSFDPERSDNVVAQFTIKSKYHIPEDTKARIFSEGIMGGKAIELELGNSDKLIQPNDTLFSEINKDFLEVAGSEFDFMKQRVNEVINELMITLKQVNSLMADNKANLSTTIRNTALMSGQLNTMIAQERGNIHGIFTNLNGFSKNLNSKSDEINHILGNVRDFSDSLKSSPIPSMVSQMTTTLSHLNTTLDKVNNGNGTIGKFINDQALYDSLVMTSANLSALLQDIKERPGRYINVSVFGRRNDD